MKKNKGNSSLLNILNNNNNKKQRNNNKKEKPVSIPSFIDIVAVGNGYYGSPKCLIVNMPHFKYMFNCGEGTQRIATEHRKLKGANRVFLTNNKWQNVGGLIGLSLTLETAETPKLYIHGPPQVEHHVVSSRSFSKLEFIEIVKEEVSTEKFVDSSMAVEFIPLRPVRGERDGNEDDCIDVKRKKLSQEMDTSITSVAYFCKPHAKQRKVDLEKCVDLNIPAGPHLALLKEGHEVTLPNTDRVIKPDDVLSDAEPNHCFLVVECTTLEEVDDLMRSPVLLPYKRRLSGGGGLNTSSSLTSSLTSSASSSLPLLSSTSSSSTATTTPISSSSSPPSHKLSLIVHFTHSTILNHPLYKSWINSFTDCDDIQHMVLNDSYCNNNLQPSSSSPASPPSSSSLPSSWPPSSSLPPLSSSSFTTISNNLPTTTISSSTTLTQQQQQTTPSLLTTSTTTTTAATTSNEVTATMDTEAMFKMQSYLHLVHPQIFPPLPYDNGSTKDYKLAKNPCGEIGNMIYARTNTKYTLRPVTEEPFNFEQCININNDAYINELYNTEDGLKEFMEQWRNESNFQQVTSSNASNPEIVFLGTGSAVPNKYRNVSSIWINLGNEMSIVLDSGENSCGQLFRHYGVKGGYEKLERLVMAYVSHLHADHHLGLIGFAVERYNYWKNKRNSNNVNSTTTITTTTNVNTTTTTTNHISNSPSSLSTSQLATTTTKTTDEGFDRLVVIAPRALMKWYTQIHCSDIPILDLIDFIPCESLYNGMPQEDNEALNKLYKLTGISKITTVRVEHAQHPHGIVLEGCSGGDDNSCVNGVDSSSGWKIVYSGDTMPSDKLIEAGQDCDLLIHEATFDAWKADEAKEKRHSTTDQAIKVGRAMGAKFTMLTHFSQRYDKLPLFTDDFGDDVGVAFDNMRVTLKDLNLLPKFVPAYKRIFASEYEEMTQLLENKQFRKERQLASRALGNTGDGGINGGQN